MKPLRTLSASLLPALGLALGLSTGCLDLEEPAVSRAEQEGIFGQGIFGQGIFGQGIFGQGIFGQGIFGQGVSADGSPGGFDGTLNGAEFKTKMRLLRAPLTDVRIVGSELRATRNGVAVSGTGLKYATWTSNGLQFRIADVRTARFDTTMPSISGRTNNDAWEYKLEWRSGSLQPWELVCNEGPKGDRFATLVPGSWDESRAYHGDGNITVGCSAGTIHKCAFRWGYKRWKRYGTGTNKQLVSMAPLHSACVYAASAVLCESGQAHTKDGTLVDMIDKYGFNVASTQADLDHDGVDADIIDFVSESWYDQNGVLAVNYERYAVYFGDTAPSGSSVAIYEYDENDVKQYACTRPRQTSGDAPGWLIKIKSDKNQWPALDTDLPFDGGIIDDIDAP